MDLLVSKKSDRAFMITILPKRDLTSAHQLASCMYLCPHGVLERYSQTCVISIPLMSHVGRAYITSGKFFLT